MKKDSKNNPVPIAPTSANPSNATGSKPRVAPVEKGTLVKKKNAAAGGATGVKANRSQVKATSGARYGIRVSFQKTEAPEAGAIQANGRILPSSIVRQSQNFMAGSSDLV
jgi:hypothetical protein